ncbi:DUF5719 family protein [Phycicoccus sonneratiae]|uniref:Secreted protein n=1 Tax=Phycicoccus sonneratiae TaxID=2807628 RepID=A0ABS2CPH4_9MICO|nr:DUF5719 family protein [Phycicoccus sonneraticus]MBM6400959.1 hypothetical protein [Phycicoccus sonneraticus]
MSRLARLRPGLPAATRVVVGGGLAAALVWVAATHADTLDLAAASGAEEAPVAPTSLATSTDTMCPGNELSGIGGVDDVGVGGLVAAASGPESLLPVPATGDGRARLTGGSATLEELSGRPTAAQSPLPRTGPVAVRATGSLAPAVTATQEWISGRSDLRGLVTTPCLAAGSDLWLLGGGSGAGRQERLVLVNPGGNPVTADVTVHGTAGPVAPARTETVPPGGRSTLLLDAVAGEEGTPAVHVVADGGGLHATLTDTWLVGSTPRGAETVVPADAPSSVQVVPAAVLGSGRATVRVVSTGGEDAVASVTLLGRDGPVATTEDTVVTVPGEGVAELALPTVPPGAYSVVVRSDVPVAAAVLSVPGDAKAAGDIGWATSAPALDGLGGAALPSTKGVSRSLRLVSTGGASTADLTLVVDGEQRTRTVSLLADRAADVDLAGASAVWVERTGGSGSLRGGIVSVAGSGAGLVLSEIPLEPVAVTSPVSRAFPLP